MYNQHVVDYYYHISVDPYNDVINTFPFFKALNEELMQSKSQEPDDWFMEELYEYEMI